MGYQDTEEWRRAEWKAVLVKAKYDAEKQYTKQKLAEWEAGPGPEQMALLYPDATPPRFATVCGDWQGFYWLVGGEEGASLVQAMDRYYRSSAEKNQKRARLRNRKLLRIAHEYGVPCASDNLSIAAETCDW